MTAIATDPVEGEADTASLAEVRPEPLLGLVDRRRPMAPAVGSRAARALISRLLARMSRDSLTIVDSSDGATRATTYPPRDAVSGPDPLRATIDVRDGRAWSAVLTEGSVGLGRGYLEGWWESDDPVTVVRILIRNLGWLDDVRDRVAARTGWVTRPIRAAIPSPGREQDREDIASHYDLGNEFFELFLDETMTYSSGVFPSAGATLAEASRHKYDRILDKLGVHNGHSVLEIGTGWGGFALRAVAQRDCAVTTTTVSDQQFREAGRRIQEAGACASVTLLDDDWRDLTGRFDRVVSIEMIEAVGWREYDRYFATVERHLESDGAAAIQAICVPDRRYERSKHTEDFIRRFIFPGGVAPSLGAISESVARATHLQIVDVEDISAHYAETLRRWRRRFDDRIDDVKALGLDERFCRLWRFYLAYCEAGFTERHCTVKQIVLAGPDWRGADLSAD